MSIRTGSLPPHGLIVDSGAAVGSEGQGQVAAHVANGFCRIPAKRACGR